MLITRTIGLVKTQASLAKHLANPSFLVGLQEEKTGSALVHGEAVSSIEDPAAGCAKLGAVQPDVDQLFHRARMDRHLKALQLAQKPGDTAMMARGPEGVHRPTRVPGV